MWSRQGHAARITALTVLGTVIVLPLVIFVLGPNMPPGKGTDVGKQPVFDNTVLLVVMTPITVFILVCLGYALYTFRWRPEDGMRDGAAIPGHLPSQVAWLSVTTVAVLFLAIFGTIEV